MDMDDEMRRLKWLLVVVVIFLFSTFFAWREMKYALLGVKTDATLVRVYESKQPGRRGRTIEKLAVEYQFTDKGTVRKETDLLSIDTDPPTGETVSIQYLSGSPDSSRLTGHSQQFWILIFLASVGFMGFKFWRLMQQSKA